MLRRQPLFVAVEPAIVGSGIVPDAHRMLAPLWIMAEGVRFFGGKVLRKKESTKLLFGQSGNIRGIGQQILPDQTKVLWFVSGQDIWRWDGFYLNKVGTLPVYSKQHVYVDFAFYGTWAFINQGVGAVAYWNGTTFGIVPEMPVNVSQTRKHLSFLMALGTGSRKTGLSWSDANNILNWTPQSTNAAGTVYFDEFDGTIVAGAPIGPHIAVYGKNHMGLATFLGAPFYFGQRTVLQGLGCIGKQALTTDGQTNYGVSRNGIWMTNGVEFDYIDDLKLHEHLQREVDWDQGERIIATRNDLSRTLEFHFPLKGAIGLTESWSYDPRVGSFGQIASVDFQDERTIFSAPIVADKDGWIKLLDTQDANKLNMALETKPLLMQMRTPDGLVDAHTSSIVDEVEVLLNRALNVEMQVGCSADANGPFRWTAWIALDKDKTTYKVPAPQMSGVYWKLKFRSQAQSSNVMQGAENVLEDAEQIVSYIDFNSWDFDLQGFVLYGEVTGAKK